MILYLIKLLILMSLFLTHYPLAESLIDWLGYTELKRLSQINDRYRNRFQPSLESKRQSELKKLQKWLASYGQNYTLEQLTNLEWLNLDYNQITVIPPEIGQLTNLEMLYLRQNQITEIPPEIGQLTKRGIRVYI